MGIFLKELVWFFDAQRAVNGWSGVVLVILHCEFIDIMGGGIYHSRFEFLSDYVFRHGR